MATPLLCLRRRPPTQLTGVRSDRTHGHRAAPFGRQLCRRFIRVGQRRGQAYAILQLRRHFLVRAQTPASSRRTNPVTRFRVAPVSHRHADRANHGVQRQCPSLPLAQGGKARPLDQLALAAVAPNAGASIPFLLPTLPLPFPSGTVLCFGCVSFFLPRLMVVLGRRGTVTPPL